MKEQIEKNLINSDSFLTLQALITQDTQQPLNQKIKKRTVIDKELKKQLFFKIYNQSKKIKQAADEVGINYSSAKTMMFYHRKKMVQSSQNKIQCTYGAITPQCAPVIYINDNFSKSNKYYFEIEKQINIERQKKLFDQQILSKQQLKIRQNIIIQQNN